MSPRERIKQAADRCSRDAAEMLEAGEFKLAEIAFQSYCTLLRASLIESDEECQVWLDALLKEVPELFPN